MSQSKYRPYSISFLLLLASDPGRAWVVPTTPDAESAARASGVWRPKKKSFLKAKDGDTSGSPTGQGGGDAAAPQAGSQQQGGAPTIQERVKARLPNLEIMGDLSGGRPGAIIETEEELLLKGQILAEIEDSSNDREYPQWMEDYGTLLEEEEAQYDTDDPNAVDSSTIGQYTFKDLESKFDYEWDPESGEPDPNTAELNMPGVRYYGENDVDEDGVEIGYDPMFGPSNPMDKRAIRGTVDSYVIDEATRDESMLTPQFEDGDLEIGYNQEVIDFRKSLDIIESYTDEFLPPDMPVPRHVAKWHGYPEPMWYPPKDPRENTFTKPEDETDFSNLTPYEARRKAVELARAKNADWMPHGMSHAWHKAQRQPYENVGTLVGTQRPGEIDPEIKERIEPALSILGSCAELLSIERGTIFRFNYHGLMKNRHGMSCWTETLIRDCGVDVSNVIFETGFRKRDADYDGGDRYYEPIF